MKGVGKENWSGEGKQFRVSTYGASQALALSLSVEVLKVVLPSFTVNSIYQPKHLALNINA